MKRTKSYDPNGSPVKRHKYEVSWTLYDILTRIYENICSDSKSTSEGIYELSAFLKKHLAENNIHVAEDGTACNFVREVLFNRHMSLVDWLKIRDCTPDQLMTGKEYHLESKDEMKKILGMLRSNCYHKFMLENEWPCSSGGKFNYEEVIRDMENVSVERIGEEIKHFILYKDGEYYWTPNEGLANIGTGGYGNVFRLEFRNRYGNLIQSFALKVIKQENDEGDYEYYRNIQINVQRGTRCPSGVIKTRELEPRTHYIMPLTDGSLHGQQFDEVKADQITDVVYDLLNCFTDNGSDYWDMKPSNVLKICTGTGLRLFIGDLGSTVPIRVGDEKVAVKKYISTLPLPTYSSDHHYTRVFELDSESDNRRRLFQRTLFFLSLRNPEFEGEIVGKFVKVQTKEEEAYQPEITRILRESLDTIQSPQLRSKYYGFANLDGLGELSEFTGLKLF